jgi:hypothetical protein
MQFRKIGLIAAALIAGWVCLAPGPPAPPGTGVWTSSGTAPSGAASDRDEVTPGSFGSHSPGTLSVSSVSVDGAVKTRGTDYEVQGEGTSELKIVFYPGKEPPSGASVSANGSCSNSNHTPYSGTNTFS